VVAVAKARLHDAGIAAVALLVARTDDIKEFLDLGNIADFRNRLAAGMQPPFFPSVTSFSTIGRSSFAFGSVVMICSCLISDAAILANMASRCSAVRLSLR